MSKKWWLLPTNITSTSTTLQPESREERQTGEEANSHAQSHRNRSESDRTQQDLANKCEDQLQLQQLSRTHTGVYVQSCDAERMIMIPQCRRVIAIRVPILPMKKINKKQNLLCSFFFTIAEFAVVATEV
jgi:hypothetical protein